MKQAPTFRDDAIAAVVAFATGSAAGFVVAWATGMASYLVFEADCHGEYLCGSGAAISGIIFGFVIGMLAFVVAAVLSLRKHATVGRRLRSGLLTFFGVPIFLAILFAVGGLF